MKQHAHRVVIVGGGAGGLELAARLGRQFGPKHIFLVDEASTHVWKPSLHEVAAGTLDIHREGLSYFVLARQCGFTFVHGSMEALDRGAREVKLQPVTDTTGAEVFPARSLEYDTLVLAIGSKSNFFGTPGAPEHAIALDSTQQAEHFRISLLRELATLNGKKAARRAETSDGTSPQAAPGDGNMMAEDGVSTAPTDMVTQAGSTATGGTDMAPARGTVDERSGTALDIAIVGGGATGVELAAELVEAMDGLAYYGIDELIPTRDVKITLIEGADRILSALPEKLSIKAQRLLHEKGIAVRTSVRVAHVYPDRVVDSEGREYAADLCVWAAGIEAPAILTELGLQTNRRNQVVVNGRLQSSDPHILAFGDCAEAPWEGKDQPLPAKAQVANQQAAYLHEVLSARIKGHAEPSASFRFRDYGSLVSVGHSEGVGSLMGSLSGKSWFVEGLMARLMYMSLHLRHHMAVLGALPTVSIALGRLLLRRGTPRVKLH